MGHCQNMEDQLFGYLDNELDTLQKKEIKRHLDGCQECARFAEQIGTLRKSMQEMRKIDASDQLIVNLRECISKEQNKKNNIITSIFTTRKWVPAVSFAAVLIVASVFIVDNQWGKEKIISNNNTLNTQTELNGTSDNALAEYQKETPNKAIVTQDTIERVKNLEEIQSRVTPVNY